MNIIGIIFYFVIAIGILVLIHEFGHFISAKLSGMRADIFSFGMGYRLFGWNKKTGFTFGKLPDDWDGEGHTDYRLSLFPIGGYVKIAGMVDESFDTEYAEQEPKPYEFRSKNTFIKAFVISAGVIMNVLLAILIFSITAFIEGKTIIETTTVAYVKNGSIADRLGFKVGDEIVSINGKSVTEEIDGKEHKSWKKCFDYLILDVVKSNNDSIHIYIIRNGKDTTLNHNNAWLLSSIENKDTFGISPSNFSVVINRVLKDVPAETIGLASGDTIYAINKEPINSSEELTNTLSQNIGKKIFLQWKRNEAIMSDSVAPNQDGRLGIEISDVYTGAISNKKYNLLEAIEVGANKTWGAVELFVASVYKMFKGLLSVEKNLGGIITVAQQSAIQAQRGIINFMEFIGFLSITLALINILPIPALDGGHLVFIIIEGIIGREIPVRVKLRFQQIGFFLLMLLIAFTIYVDIKRIFF